MEEGEGEWRGEGVSVMMVVVAFLWREDGWMLRVDEKRLIPPRREKCWSRVFVPWYLKIL